MTSGIIYDRLLMKLRHKTIKELDPVLWWDANYGINVADGATVSSWAARVGGVTLTQVTGSKQPYFLLNGVGGYPAVLFGNGRYMSAAAAVINTALVGTMVAVIERSAATTASDQFMFSGQKVGDANQIFGLGMHTSGVVKLQHNLGVGTLGVVTGGTALGTTRHVLVITNPTAGGDWTCKLDKVAETLSPGSSGNTGTWFGDVSGMDSMTVGALGSSGPNNWGGKLSHLAFWNSVL